MPQSNFPKGFASITIKGVPLMQTHPGKVFWVYNGTALLDGQKAGSNGNKGTFDAPFSTIDYAVGRCVANRGDIIFVKPGHSETVSAADGIDFDVAGIAVVGLGSGSLKPKIIFDTANTADINVSAANVLISNFQMEAGFADIVRGIQVTAAHCKLYDIDWRDQEATENWLTPIKATSTTDNNADGLEVVGNTWFSVDAAGVEFIEGNADIRYAVVKDNVVVHEGTAAPLILMATGKDLKYATITHNFLSHKNTSGALFVSADTTGVNNSGIVAHNRIGHADVTGAHTLFAADNGFRLFDNLSTSVNNLSGFVLPAIDVDL